MEYRKVSVVVFYDEERKILLQDREGIARVGEEWGFFGGGIEEGETPEEAIVREVQEELGHKLKDFEFVGQVRKDQKKHNRVVDVWIFISPIGNNFTKFVQHDGKGMKWVSIPEARKLKLADGDDKILNILEKVI